MERRSDGTERAGENMKCMEGGEKMEETRGGGRVEFFTCLCFTTLYMHGCTL